MRKGLHKQNDQIWAIKIPTPWERACPRGWPRTMVSEFTIYSAWYQAYLEGQLTLADDLHAGAVLLRGHLINSQYLHITIHC